MGPIIDAQACSGMLGCTPEHVEELARTGEIPALKIGRSWRFVFDDLLAYLAEKARSEAEERRRKHQSPAATIKPPRRRAPPSLPEPQVR
jgi:excisionase family DNA binding protein